MCTTGVLPSLSAPVAVIDLLALIIIKSRDRWCTAVRRGSLSEVAFVAFADTIHDRSSL